MNAKLACLALSLGWLVGSTAHADSPALIPLQGYLTDRNDKALQGELEMLFALYARESGGEAVFQETQRVLVQQGHSARSWVMQLRYRSRCSASEARCSSA